MCHHAELRLHCRVDSVPVGRHLVGDTLDEWKLGPHDPAFPARDDVLLASTELLANAVKVCNGDITLRIDAHRDHIEVGVSDDSRNWAVESKAERYALGGRGLTIVASLSEEWGQHALGDGRKEVWCRIPLPTGSVFTADCML